MNKQPDIAPYIEKVNARLTELEAIEGANETLRSAMGYSLRAGGKRLRPVLNLMANELLNGDAAETLDIACAIEMIHTYSLVHDDLPAMDNDEMRRGKPTSHVVFGEAFAILAGDGLLNYAFEVMLRNALRFPQNLEAHVRAMDEVARGAGVTGMITGQCADIENEGQMLTDKELTYVHAHKTGAMIKSALLAGLLLCKPDQKQIAALALYGEDIGLTFQIIDDILDVTGDQVKMGKTLGKDKDAHKFTYVTLYGVDQSKKIAVEKTEEAVGALDVFGGKADQLRMLARSILERDM